MKGEHIVGIVRTPAFAIFIGTICIIVVMRQIPVVITAVKEARKN